MLIVSSERFADLRMIFGALAPSRVVHRRRVKPATSKLRYASGGNASAVENQAAARSRIMDADFAAETASLTRAQVLQQAGTAMLSQANSLPNNVLGLLR